MLKIKENFECREVLGDYMVIPKGEAMQEFSGTLVLSETAACAWKMLEQGCTLQELTEKMAAEFDAPTEVIGQDMEELIERLEAYQVLEKDA